MNPGFIAVWALGALSLIGAFFGVWAQILVRQESYTQERTAWLIAETQAQCFLQKAVLEIESIDPKDITGAWAKEALRGVFYWNPSRKGRWLGYEQTEGIDLKDMAAGPQNGALRVSEYMIDEAQESTRGLLWDPVAGEAKKTLEALLKTPEAERLRHVKHWKTLLEPATHLDPTQATPTLLEAKLELQGLAATPQSALTLSLHNPFAHKLQGPLSIKASITLNPESIQSILSRTAKKSFLFISTQDLDLEPGAFLDIHIFPEAPSKAQSTNAADSVSLGTPSGHTRHYSLDPPKHTQATKALYCWQSSSRKGLGPLGLRTNLQPQQAKLQACAGAPQSHFLKNLTPFEAQTALLKPVTHSLEHLGQLCRATPGHSEDDPTWPFGAPKRPGTRPSAPPAHARSPTAIQHPTGPSEVHRIGPYSVWDHAFIAPTPGKPSPYYIPSKGAPSAPLQVRNPINVNSASAQQWEQALQALLPPTLKDPQTVIKALAQTLSTPPSGPWLSVVDYVESGVFQSALSHCGLEILLQSSFLEPLAPRLCVRSDSFSITTLGSAPHKGRTLQYRLKKHAQRLHSGQVVVTP